MTITMVKGILQFCDNCKIQLFTDYLEITEGKITTFVHFYDYHKNCKKHESLYDFGGCCQELNFMIICMDFEPCLKVNTLISVRQHKSTKHGQMNHLNMIFHAVVSNYRLVKI